MRVLRDAHRGKGRALVRTMLLVTVACKNMAYLLDIVVRMAFYSPKKANIGGHTFPDTSGSKE